jgi:uncharacterized protein (TIGR03118 family)
MNLSCVKLKSVLTSLSAAALMTACGGGGDSMPYGGGMGTSGYVATSLVSDIGATGNPYASANVDTHLVNAWGLAFNPNGFVWVANNGTSTSTLYDGNGVPQTLVVSIPAGTAGPAAPTGIVFNGSTDFVVSQGGTSGASPFIFVGEAGTLSGWSPGVNLNNAIKVFDGAAAGAVYKGLALASSGGANFLYAADFHNARVDVFDAMFTKVAAAGGFTDPTLPAGYAPFGIQAIGGSIYVAFAKQDATGHDDVAGAGLGLVDVFDAAGHFVKRLVDVGGALNAPWGMALAPANFGTFSNALLVANFGDGKINAFNASTGASMGTLSNSAGMPIAIDGLWGIAFGNGLNNQPTNTLFFTGGPSDETHGVYGRIDFH